ncbi:Alpha/beta hydrolase [Rubrivivax sp. A210]|uniref:alpha/beta fold hydrolase n=1 Tax=Rubrivivax sp. A210 TaxID=2772301 RepID=UPI00191A1C81|nr:alpha/beta hydrolase [Rubrivivax sp. A210]CAD5374453.1 Alpha/beta hydrolase [Rubrivivax sp. A210]
MKLQVQGHAAYAYTGGPAFDASRPGVVFVHGALNDHSVWTLLARWLAHHGHAVLAVDLPGHGRSEGPPLPDVEATADWLLALLDAAGVAQAALVGHSMGSLIALEAAARAPARITRLVMVGSAYPMKVSEALLATAREQPLLAIDRVNAFSMSTWASKPSYPGPGAWVHGGNRALMRRIQAQATQRLGLNLFAHDFAVCDRYAGGLEAAARVACPASLILGSRDQMTPPRAAAGLATALKARVTTLACGHALMAEAPDATLAALRTALG